MNPFWFGNLFRKFPALGIVYHLMRAFRLAGRISRRRRR